MTLILKQLFGLLKLLNSETGTNQIASGVACGFILGMSPGLSLQTLLIVLCLLFFRIQIGAALISMFFFKFMAFLLDPAFDLLGDAILTMESLRGLFTILYNMPLVPFTKFNNTIVMGAGILALILSPLIYMLSKKLIIKYRETVVERIKGTKAWKALKATAFFKWYYKYDKLYGN